MSITFPIQVKELSLGEVFSYILSDEWGLSSELPIKDEAPLYGCHNVHYREANEAEKSDQSQINGGLDCGNPAAG